MKWISQMILWALLAVIGTGCSESASGVAGEQTSGTAMPQMVTLRYMIWDINQEPAYRRIADRFSQENPGISVDIQVVPWGSYWEKLMTEIAGGTAPDVFWGYIPRVPSLVERSALLPITGYIKRDGFRLDRMNGSLVQGFSYNGEQYGIPKDWDALAVFYNQEMLSVAGYGSFPQGLTWNPKDGGTLVRFLQELTSDVNGRHPYEPGFDPQNIRQYGFNYTDRGEWDPGDLAGFIASNGAQFLTDGKLVPEGRMLDTMQFLYDLVFKYHVSPDYTNVKLAGSDQLFLSKKTALWVTGSWQLIPIKTRASFPWGIAPFPAGPNGKRVVRINGLADHIYVMSKHKEEAWSFVKFINGKEAQDILAETGTVFPMNKESIPKFIDFYKKQGLDPTVFVEEFNGDTVTMPITKNYMEWVRIWFREMGLIFSGGIDLRSGIETVASEGNAIAEGG